MKRTYSHALNIQAPAPGVWSVLSDVIRWPEWTPTVRRVAALSRDVSGVGCRFRVDQPGLPGATWVVTEWNPGSGFTWVSAAPGVEVTARHVLEVGEGATRLVLSLEYAGLFGGLLARWTHRFNTSYPELEAEGLKRRCEALAAGLPPPPLSSLEIPWTAPPAVRYRRAASTVAV